MKKLSVLLVALFYAVAGFSVTINVSILNSSFSPANFSANVGDVVMWTNNGSLVHNTVSSSVPGGANTWNSGTMATSATFSYTITTAGTYNYSCTIHGFTGSFTVAPLGVKETDLNVASVIFPNPFKNKVTISYKKADNVIFYNVTGKALKTFELSAFEASRELDLSDLPAGIYFYALYSDGIVSETRKIVKGQ
jgi:plastocyanin